jgi:AraC-like DNA-binding protein
MKRSLEFAGTGPLTAQDGHEILAHGTPRFRMSAHKTIIPSGSSRILYSHWHEEFEFLFFTRGQARFQLAKEELVVREHDVIIIQPNILHSAGRIDKLSCEFYAVLVHYNFLASIENDDVQQNYILPLFSGRSVCPNHIRADLDDKHSLLNALQTIAESYQREDKGYELFIKSKFYEVFYLMSKYAALYPDTIILKDGAISNTTWVKNFLQFVQENFSDRITLADMARTVNMSESHLCRESKRVFGISPVEFLNNYRVSRAVHLIETTNRSLGDISDITGFPNINRFTTTFKKIFHCTPISYRMELRHVSSVALSVQ